MADELLTTAELHAIDLTVELVNVLTHDVIGSGPTRSADIGEMVRHVHDLQHLVMAQAAARAYPERFRLLGESLD